MASRAAYSSADITCSVGTEHECGMWLRLPKTTAPLAAVIPVDLQYIPKHICFTIPCIIDLFLSILSLLVIIYIHSIVTEVEIQSPHIYLPFTTRPHPGRINPITKRKCSVIIRAQHTKPSTPKCPQVSHPYAVSVQSNELI